MSHDACSYLIPHDAGDHIAVLPNQRHMMAEIEVMGEHLGLSKAAATQLDHASLDTPFDLEILEHLPHGALDGLELG